MIFEGIGRLPSAPAILRVASSAPDGSRVIGLTFSDGRDAIGASAQFEVRSSVIRLCGDGLDYDGGGAGLVIGPVIEGNL